MRVDGKTILVTFAGRRDRMELLARYVEAAIERGLIDEWHVWDFARNASDALWLQERFPVVQATPNYGLTYFRATRRLEVGSSGARLKAKVRATNDVHIGLKRASGRGPDYEIVIGGWGNRASAIRKFREAGELLDMARRDPSVAPTIVRDTPNVLPEFGFVSIALNVGRQGLSVAIDGEALMRDSEPIEPGEFDVLYRTGFGANGDWRFADFEARPMRRFSVGPELYYPKDAMFYTRAYQYYGANADEFANDVILKCDDDIAYVDLEGLARFVNFRRKHEEFFLVSADVVNNGVCAFFQQAAGVIPHGDDRFELPPGGLCGSLWSDGAKAERLHRFFLSNRARFQGALRPPVRWNERVSINFVALLGQDLKFIPDVMRDDEHDLCYGVRKRTKKENCIYPQFTASHLSFWKQDAGMNVAALLEAYRALADETLNAPAVSQAAIEEAESKVGADLPQVAERWAA